MADLAVAGEVPGTPAPAGGRPGIGAAPRRSLRPFAALAAAFAAEGDRRILWLPVFFGTGIALYFALTIEPPPWIGGAATIAAAAIAVALRRWPALRNAGDRAGFCRGRVRGDAAGALGARHPDAGAPARPGRDHRQGHRYRPARPRLADHRRARSAPRPRGRRPAAPPAHPHRPDQRSVAARRPGQPQGPRSTRCRRSSCRAGATCSANSISPGSAGSATAMAGRAASRRPQTDAGGGWREWLLRLRAEMTARINAALPGSTGGVASAVITGKRGTMAEEVKDAFRQSGLSHLLAIAGLHLGLVGGFVFFAVRGGLALIPWLALRYPIKKIAAVVTLDRAVLLSDDLGRGDPDRARLRHERHRLRRDPDRPAAAVDADLRAAPPSSCCCSIRRASSGSASRCRSARSSR